MPHTSIGIVDSRSGQCLPSYIGADRFGGEELLHGKIGSASLAVSRKHRAWSIMLRSGVERILYLLSVTRVV